MMMMIIITITTIIINSNKPDLQNFTQALEMDSFI